VKKNYPAKMRLRGAVSMLYFAVVIAAVGIYVFTSRAWWWSCQFHSPMLCHVKPWFVLLASVIIGRRCTSSHCTQCHCQLYISSFSSRYYCRCQLHCEGVHLTASFFY